MKNVIRYEGETDEELYKRRLMFYLDTTEPDTCWNWTGNANKKGYGMMRAGHTMRYTHKLSYELHKGTVTDGMLVCHTCDNPACCNPEHLFLGTNQDNMDDMIRKGRSRKGVDNRAKLTEDDVIQIRELRKNGYGYTQLSRMFPVNPTTVKRICIGEKWKHLLPN